MKFKFKTKTYQQDAVNKLCKVFKGQPYFDMVRYTRDLGIRRKKVEAQIDMIDTGAFEVNDDGFENAKSCLKMQIFLQTSKKFNKITTTKNLKNLFEGLVDVRLILKWKQALVKPMFT